jgi:hypothetical protein
MTTSLQLARCTLQPVMDSASLTPGIDDVSIVVGKA